MGGENLNFNDIVLLNLYDLFAREEKWITIIFDKCLLLNNKDTMRDLLATRISLGDQKAFELLFRKYYNRLCAFANKFLNDRDEAQDIVQDVFANIWENKETLETIESINAYIFKLTQNRCINQLKRRKVISKNVEILRLLYSDHSEFPSYNSLFIKELEDKISRTIENLPPECSRIFKLSRIKGLKYSEIADLLNLSVKTVEAQISKALRILRTELSEFSGM